MKYPFDEVFSIPTIRNICEQFTEMEDFVTALLDLDGNIHIATGWQDACTHFHRVNPKSCARCLKSDTTLAGQLEAGESYNVYRCRNGLMDVAVPVVVDGEHVANFFTGQFFTEKPDLEFFRAQARELGFDEADYLDAISRVPIHDQTRVKQVMKFLVRLTELIGELGLEKLRMLEAKDAQKQELEELVREQSSQLARMQKMDALGQLTGGIAHDFNNLLSVIQGNIEIARMNVETGSDPRENFDKSLAAVRHGAQLIQQLLSFAQKQTLAPHSVDTNEFLRATLQIIERTLGGDISIVTELDPDSVPVSVDTGLLTTAILNIAMNARHAMPNGGVMTVSTSRQTLDAKRFPLSDDVASGDYSVITIKDNGVGIPEESLESIVEPFFTTREVGQGSGLGLSMVHGFIRQSNGHLTINSDENTGTTVSLYLPVDESGMALNARIPARNLPEGVQRSVLLVEDDAELRSVLKDMLMAMGSLVIEADSGKRALEIITEQHAQIDVIISDIVMPGGVSGIDLAEQTMRDYPQLKLILISGYADKQLPETIKDSCHFFRKPFRLSELQACMAGLFAMENAENAAGRRTGLA